MTMQNYGFAILLVSLSLICGDYALMAFGYAQQTIVFELINQVGVEAAIVIWASPFFIGLFVAIASSPRAP